MNEVVVGEVNTTNTETAEEPTTEAPAAGAATEEQYIEQLKYAQKLLQVLQGKLNEVNGINIQLEAKLQIAEEKLTKEG